MWSLTAVDRRASFVMDLMIRIPIMAMDTVSRMGFADLFFAARVFCL
jgi:hypothetical protein